MINPQALITINLNEALRHFNFVAGVVYRCRSNKRILLCPHETGNFEIADCSIIDRKSFTETGDYYPFHKDDLGKAIHYQPSC